MPHVTYKEISDLVLQELHTSLGVVKEEEVEKLIELVLGARKVFFIGVGRVMLLGDVVAKMIIDRKEPDMKGLWQYHANLE